MTVLRPGDIISCSSTIINWKITRIRDGLIFACRLSPVGEGKEELFGNESKQQEWFTRADNPWRLVGRAGPLTKEDIGHVLVSHIKSSRRCV